MKIIPWQKFKTSGVLGSNYKKRKKRVKKKVERLSPKMGNEIEEKAHLENENEETPHMKQIYQVNQNDSIEGKEISFLK